MAKNPIIINEINDKIKCIKSNFEHSKLNIVMVMAHLSMVESTCISIFLHNVIEICFGTNSLCEGNMTRCHNQGFSTIDNGMYLFVINKTKPLINYY
jgi:hypothetical protein